MNNENAFARSALPQPSRSPPSKKLSEMTASANNARPPSMLPPPPGTLKRKTLAERAGEPPRPAPAPPGSRSLGQTIKPTSIAAASRQNSYSSSTSSRPASSTSYRNASSSSFASSTSSRVPSAQSFRSQTSMSNHQKSRSMYAARPATAFEQNTARDGQETSANSTVVNFSSARQFSANTSRRKKPVLDMNYGIQPEDIARTDKSASSVSGNGTQMCSVKSLRDLSLNTAMTSLSLNTDGPLFLAPRGNGKENVPPSPQTPSQIPKKKPSVPKMCTPSPTKTVRKTPSKPVFLTKDSNLMASDWDLGSRVENMESMYAEMKKTMAGTVDESNSLKENIALYKARINELEDMKRDAHRDNKDLRQEIEKMSRQLEEHESNIKRVNRDHEDELISVNKRLEDSKRCHVAEVEELESKSRRSVNTAIQDAEVEKRRIERAHLDELEDLKRKLEKAIEEERELRHKEVSTLSSEGSLAQQKIEGEVAAKNQELQGLREDLDRAKEETNREKAAISKIKAQLDDASSTIVSNESTMRSLRAHVEFLESDNKSQSQSFADLERKTQEAIREAEEARAKLRTEETLRRKLHNQVQELKGNIRVFCRVRPTLPNEESENARIAFPDSSADSKELEVMGQEEKSSLGTITTKKNAFAFDRVFAPQSQNAEVFDEISQLVQSALDGYNVCIFCYGQTGSGKTYTMSSKDGMIPRAVNQIYETAQSLEEKGWKYGMEGSFVEVYNESINDLLGKAEDFDKKKHEIRHDMQRSKTTITDITTVDLDSPGKVESALHDAMNNRSIAATKANERSSRSHTVFILKLTGENSITGEKSEGTLNLVDLAGSERLSHSGATGERLKETQNINKSLSCLGDVIGALGQGKDGGHIPYRNSKLTYLLQFSLGGNSKTLMFVMVSPLQAHLSETVTSLKFATKVHNTHIGTAKRQAKVRD